MRWVVPALVVAVLAKSALLSAWFPPRFLPDVALILVVLYGGLRGWRPGLMLGLLGGSIESLLSAAPIGVLPFRLGAVGLGAGLSESRFDRTGPLLPPTLVAAATVAGALLAALALQAAGWVVSISGSLAADYVVQALINGLLSVALLPLLRRALAARPAGDEVVV